MVVLLILIMHTYFKVHSDDVSTPLRKQYCKHFENAVDFPAYHNIRHNLQPLSLPHWVETSTLQQTASHSYFY